MQTLNKSLKTSLLGNGIPLSIALIAPFIFRAIDFPFGMNVSIFIMFFIISASGLDILFGYSGQMSMGHAGFYAIGAYGSALLASHLNIPVPLTMLIAPILAAAVGALLAFPASKLKFHFLALATIAFNMIIFQLIFQSPGGITGDAIGLRVQPFEIFGWRLSTMNFQHIYYFLLGFVVLLLIAKTNLVNSRVGRAFIAIRENAHAADGMGINVRKYKVIAFAVSAFYVGLAGALFAHTIGWISAEGFAQPQSVMFVTVLLFGGTASKWGPVVGAIAVQTLDELLRPLANLQMLIYGALLLLVIVAMPGGIWGTIRDFVMWTVRKVKGGKQNA